MATRGRKFSLLVLRELDRIELLYTSFVSMISSVPSLRTIIPRSRPPASRRTATSASRCRPRCALSPPFGSAVGGSSDPLRPPSPLPRSPSFPQARRLVALLPPSNRTARSRRGEGGGRQGGPRRVLAGHESLSRSRRGTACRPPAALPQRPAAAQLLLRCGRTGSPRACRRCVGPDHASPSPAGPPRARDATRCARHLANLPHRRDLRRRRRSPAYSQRAGELPAPGDAAGALIAAARPRRNRGGANRDGSWGPGDGSVGGIDEGGGLCVSG